MKLEKLLSDTGELPTLPMVANRINQEMHKDALTAKLLGEIISEDTALSAKVLRLANSAYYGLQKQVTSLNKAVMVLGFNTVKNLALSVSIYGLFKKTSKSSIDVKGLWLHSLGCAAATKMLIESVNPKLGDDGFLFGILHDLGKIIIINAAAEEYEKVLQLMLEENIPENEAEINVLGITHQKVGVMLMEQWKFPDTIIHAVKLHHETDITKKKLDADLKDLIRALYVGNQMAKALSLGKSTNPQREEIPKVTWECLNISRDQLKGLAGTIRQNYALLLSAWELKENDDK